VTTGAASSIQQKEKGISRYRGYGKINPAPGIIFLFLSIFKKRASIYLPVLNIPTIARF
jgi:hypothetical protein